MFHFGLDVLNNTFYIDIYILNLKNEIFEANPSKCIYQTLKYCNLYQLKLHIKFSTALCKGLAGHTNAFFNKHTSFDNKHPELNISPSLLP